MNAISCLPEFFLTLVKKCLTLLFPCPSRAEEGNEILAFMRFRCPFISDRLPRAPEGPRSLGACLLDHPTPRAQVTSWAVWMSLPGVFSAQLVRLSVVSCTLSCRPLSTCVSVSTDLPTSESLCPQTCFCLWALILRPHHFPDGFPALAPLIFHFSLLPHF